MNFAQLIAAQRAARDAALGEVERRGTAAQAILDGALERGDKFTTPDEDARIESELTARRAAQARADAALAKINQYEQDQREDDAANAASRRTQPGADQPGGQTRDVPVGGARVIREERTYSPEKSARGLSSFFCDAYAYTSGDIDARQRLERHGQEMKVEREQARMKAMRAQTTTTFAGLIVPQYLVDMVALLIRNGRPFANSVMGMQLPPQGMSFVVPRGTTGAAVASQTPENTAVQNTDEVWANLTVSVNTIAGQQDVSRQSLERGTPGIDELVYLDLAGAYHAELDRQCINGTGASNQALGMFATSGINAATLFGAPPTYTLFNSKLAGQIAAVAGAGAGIDPQLIVMHPRRWGWLCTLLDTAGRPMVVPTAAGAYNAGGLNLRPGAYGDEGTNAGGIVDTQGFRIVGSMQGLPIFTDANVPINVGSESEDLVGVYDPSKIILWEDGDGMPTQLRFEQTLGNQLTVKLVTYGYIAFTAGRYPQAVGKIGGLDTGGATFGLVAPTF